MASILLIEDDHDTRVSLRHNLEDEGHFVFSATNGRDGLEALKRLSPSPNIIILDLGLPIMSGEEFVRRTRVLPSFAKIPILAMSSQRLDPPIGVSGFFSKPLDMDELLAAVQAQLDPRPREHQPSLFS